MTDYSDDDILKMIFENNDSELLMKVIVEKYHFRIYNHVRSILISHEDANDVTQDIFIKVWKEIYKFRGDSKLFSWMYRIATNESINFIRKNKKHSVLIRESTENYLLSRLTADTNINGSKLQIELQKAIAKLPEKQRHIFNMRYFEELKFKDIAEILGITEGGVKSSYHFAEKKIKDQFKVD